MELDKQRFYGQFPKMCSNAVLKNQIIGSDIKSWFKTVSILSSDI
jgi:hypothetical protein